MKKLLLTTLSVLLITVAGYSQRFVYVDTEYILENIPEYKAAQKKLDDQQRQAEIENKEKAVKEYQNQKFGYQGELFVKKQELVKPIQDKIYNEINKLATEKALDFVFDKANGLNMLFVNPKYDRSDEIITALGYKPGATDKK